MACGTPGNWPNCWQRADHRAISARSLPHRPDLRLEINAGRRRRIGDLLACPAIGPVSDQFERVEIGVGEEPAAWCEHMRIATTSLTTNEKTQGLHQHEIVARPGHRHVEQ